jgi:hypothetical protein
MYTAESLYKALKNDNINELTSGAIADYGFLFVSVSNYTHLFGAYQAISKFMPQNIFIQKMHQALLDNKLHETVDNLTSIIPTMFQNHWKNFILNEGRIEYIEF